MVRVKRWIFYQKDDFFFAMKGKGIRQQDLKVTDQEIMTLQMLRIIKKRIKVEPFQQQIFREDIQKNKSGNMADTFEEKYKEIKIEGKKEKIIKAYYMEKENSSHQRIQRLKSK